VSREAETRLHRRAWRISRNPARLPLAVVAVALAAVVLGVWLGG
jgi:hypothetical protein